MNLDIVDAAELAELLQFLTGWIASDPARLAPSLLAFVGHPPSACRSSATTWIASPSCSAAMTANHSSSPAHYRTPPTAARPFSLQPVTRNQADRQTHHGRIRALTILAISWPRRNSGNQQAEAGSGLF
jgi:hypothetical protein